MSEIGRKYAAQAVAEHKEKTAVERTKAAKEAQERAEANYAAKAVYEALAAEKADFNSGDNPERIEVEFDAERSMIDVARSSGNKVFMIFSPTTMEMTAPPSRSFSDPFLFDVRFAASRFLFTLKPEQGRISSGVIQEYGVLELVAMVFRILFAN